MEWPLRCCFEIKVMSLRGRHEVISRSVGDQGEVNGLVVVNLWVSCGNCGSNEPVYLHFKMTSEFSLGSRKNSSSYLYFGIISPL